LFEERKVFNIKALNIFKNNKNNKQINKRDLKMIITFIKQKIKDIEYKMKEEFRTF